MEGLTLFARPGPFPEEEQADFARKQARRFVAWGGWPSLKKLGPPARCPFTASRFFFWGGFPY